MSSAIVHGEPLRRFADSALQAMGAPDDVAAEVATHLVRSNLSGHDACGVCRLPAYAALADAGELLPTSRPRLVRETAAAAVFDAERGFGQHAAAVALDWCLARAGAGGLAAAAVRGASEAGRLLEYAERAAAAGMLAVVTSGTAGPGAGETMLHGGRERFFGANAWAFSAPGRERSFAYEGATSTISAADVLLARAKGETLPRDCLADRFGRPSTDPDDLDGGGGLVALGGAVAGHKGLGLAFASALFGGLAGDSEVPTESRRSSTGGLLIEVIDPAAFGDAGAYRDRVEGALEAAKAVRPVAGRSEVLLPGEAEARTRADRVRLGIRLPDATWTDLAAVAARFGLSLPERA